MKTLVFYFSLACVSVFGGKTVWEHYDLSNILFSSDEGGEAWSEARTAKKMILMEQLEPLHEEVKKLEQVYGPASGWLDGPRHTPAFVESAITSYSEDGFQDLKYLWKKICIGKLLIGHGAVEAATTLDLKRTALIEHQDKVYDEVEQAALSHFSRIEEVIAELNRVTCCADVDAAVNKLAQADAQYTGIPSAD